MMLFVSLGYDTFQVRFIQPPLECARVYDETKKMQAEMGHPAGSRGVFVLLLQLYPSAIRLIFAFLSVLSP